MLAFIDLPDFRSPLNRIAGSAEKMAGIAPGQGELPLATGTEMMHQAALVLSDGQADADASARKAEAVSSGRRS